jgi:hypothetical protein
MVTHTATLRPGIVGPGEPGHRVFESNYVIECTCGRSIGCATTSAATAERWRAEHERWHVWHDDPLG